MSGRLKTFVHPQKAYRLEFPAEWENLVQDEVRSCGFGPRDRDDVGLWISILPASLDTERFTPELPKLFEESLKKSDATNLRRDETLKHHAMKADTTADGQAGHYWLLAGGDLVLFASSPSPSGKSGTRPWTSLCRASKSRATTSCFGTRSAAMCWSASSNCIPSRNTAGTKMVCAAGTTSSFSATSSAT
jgi:hypothetical protein